MTDRRKPTHPGEILREDVIKPLGLTVTEAANRLGVTRKTLSALLNCRASMSPEMAVRVGKAKKHLPKAGYTCRQNWTYGLLNRNLLRLSSLERLPQSNSVYEFD